MLQDQVNDETRQYRGLSGAIKRSIYKYGVLRWLFTIPVIFVYCVSYALLSPEYKTPFQIYYEDLNKKIEAEKSGITTPITLPSDLFYYSSLWQEMIGENPLVHTLITSSLENLFKSLNFLKDIQDNDETMIKTMIREKLNKLEQKKTDPRTTEEIYDSIRDKGEYFSRLFEQLFSQHGLKKLETKYSDTDVDAFFSMLCRSPEDRQFRRLLGALVLNVPYYLVIKNSINEYYQNNDILIPVDLFSFTLFMMYLDQIKNKDARPTIEDCRNWVFSVIVPDDNKRVELQSKRFSVQEINREEMIMPNPGYFSKGYNEKKHKAIDIASERGTMIRSPLTGTVTYYEKSRKKSIVGNFIIIKDDRSNYNIFICHMDNKDFIEDHSTEGQIAEPISNLTPDWVHPLKKGQFFEVVGNTGKSTGAHTHIQIAKRVEPYSTYDFFLVNTPYQDQFNAYLKKNNYWQTYSRNEPLLLSLFGMAVTKYDSTRHFADRDPAILESYRQLQMHYTPTSVTINSLDLTPEKIPENILRTYFSKAIQEKIINDRYEDQINYYSRLVFQLNHFLKLEVPLAGNPPEKTIPLTPWQVIRRRRYQDDDVSYAKNIHDRTFYQAINSYFLYKILQLHETPKKIRDLVLSDPMFTGNKDDELPDDLPEFPSRSVEDRISLLTKFTQNITHVSVDLTFINDDDFCESIFSDITTACQSQGVPINSHFGYFRYHMEELQNSYQSSRFIHFPDTREFTYNKKYDSAIRSFFLDIFELAAENKNYGLFRELYRDSVELTVSIPRLVLRKISGNFKPIADKVRYKLFHTPYPIEPKIPPHHTHSVFQNIIQNIVKPISFESRVYADKTYYRAAESSLFYSMIYEVYLVERERYMKLFPAEQLINVIDAIGLFDSMFKVFCDNAAQKQLIDNEHRRITQELELVEKELEIYKESKKKLQDDFSKETSNLKMPDDYITKHTEVFSNYFTEEEKISKKIANLEQSIDKYRNESIVLKKEKAELELRYDEKLKTLNSEMETLRSKNILDQDRFRIEMKSISDHKEKSDQDVIDLKAEIIHLKKEKEAMDAKFNKTFKKTGDVHDEYLLLQKKYEKTTLDHNLKDSKQDIIIRNFKNDLNQIQNIFNNFANTLRNAIGPYAKDLPLEDLTKELLNILNSAGLYRERSSTIKLLQDQQKNDKRSLMLNANLITELKDRVDKLETQLKYLRDTTPSIREKELEEENERLDAVIKEFKSAHMDK